MEGFKFIEVGNTYSEYKCERCRRTIVIDMEDDTDASLAFHKAKCSPFNFPSNTEVKQ
jgi:hypothetical protein